jgi:hypothetical protein
MADKAGSNLGYEGIKMENSEFGMIFPGRDGGGTVIVRCGGAVGVIEVAEFVLFIAARVRV